MTPCDGLTARLLIKNKWRGKFCHELHVQDVLCPLTTVQLLHTLAVNLGDSKLVDDNIPDLDLIVFLCVGLIVVTGDKTPRDIIRSVRYTPQEYFERTSGH